MFAQAPFGVAVLDGIARTDIFIAAAAERTKHIRLGTGVISVGYHNPLWIAERLVMLDHLTHGRIMFGAGPGLLAFENNAALTNLLLDDAFRTAIDERQASWPRRMRAWRPHYSARIV